MKFDSVFEHIGEFGTYQKRIYYLLCMPSVSVAIQMLMAVFILNIPDHRCGIPGDKNDSYSIQDVNHELLLNKTIPWVKDDQGNPVRSSCERYDVNITNLPTTDAWKPNRTDCTYYVYDQSVFTRTVITDMDLVCDKKELRSHANMVLMGGILFGAIGLGLLSDAHVLRY